MDKEKIHIDDLVRGQFTGREEEERPGAWLHMRELLDTHMPAGQAPVAFGWRRFAGYMAVLSLATALTVGGYRYVQQYAGEEEAALQEETVAANTERAAGTVLDHTVPDAAGSMPAPERSGAVIARRQAPSADKATSADKTTTDAGSQPASAGHTAGQQAGVAGAQHTGTGMQAAGRGGTSATGTAAVPASGKSMASRAAVAGSRTGGAAASGTVPGAGEHMAGQPAGTRTNRSITTSGTSLSQAEAHAVRPQAGKRAGQAVTTATGAGEGTAHKPGRGARRPEAAAGAAARTASLPASPGKPQQGQVAAAGRQAAAGSRIQHGSGREAKDTPAAVPGSGISAAGGRAANAEFILQRDTVEKINLVYRTVINPLSRTRSVQVDTESIERMVIERRIAVAAAPPARAKAAPDKRSGRSARPAVAAITPPLSSASAGTAPATTAIVLAPGAAPAAKEHTAANAAARRSKRGGGWDPQRFEEMFLDAKFNLSQAEFYPGITGGINAMFSGGTFIPGIQLGFNGEIVFNDRWSVMTELKYINRFSNNKTIEDNYVTAPYTSGPNAPVPVYNTQTNALTGTVYTRDSVMHSFNFSSLGTLDLPISIRYAINRFFMAAGIDLVHHFRINAEEVTQPVQVLRDTISAGQPLPARWQEGGQSVYLNDLSARFGIGYLIGVGYKVTPNLSLDLRMSHMLTDNARTIGAGKVSDQLFKVPYLQFSLGYRFGSRHQPYAE